MSEYYYRLCSGLSDIGSFHPSTLSPHKAAGSLDKDLYKSVFLYTKSQVDTASEVITVTNKKTKKVYDRPKGVGFQRDVDGNEYPEIDNLVGNKLIFDFDAKDHELARKDALTLISRLSDDIPIDDIQIYFSGGKGFHVEVELQEYLKNTEIRSICLSYIEGLHTSDGSVYNSSRIFRLAITKHHKSGLYKVPLYLDDLKTMSMKDIHDHANTKFSPDDIAGAWGAVKLNDNLIKRKGYIEMVKKKEPSDKPKVAGTLAPDFETVKAEIAKLDFSSKPAYLSATKFVLHKGLIPQGVGQEARMILCSTYKSAGYDAEYAYRMLKAVSEARVKRFGSEYAFDSDELWNSVVLNVFDVSWQGGTYGPTNPLIQKIDEILPVYLKSDRYSTNLLTDLTGSGNRFRKYAKDIDKNTIKSGIKSLDDELRIQTGQVLGLIGAPGSGKCHTKGTGIMMIDGSTKLVEDVKVGDLLMGNDSTPRKVLGLARGQEKLYNIHTDSGYYGVNESHILSLRNTQSERMIHGVKPGEVVNMSVKDYLNVAESNKRRLRGYRVGVEFEHIEPEFSAYMTGSWIGDGSKSSPVITNQDKELIPVYENEAKRMGLEFKTHYPKDRCTNYSFVNSAGQTNPWYQYLKTNCLDDNGKRIPKHLLTNSKKIRRELLAGLIDTDGYYDTKKGAYEITFKEKDLISDLQYLCRSLGLRCTVAEKIGKITSINFEGLYHRAYISGDLSEVPMKIERKKFITRDTLTDKLAYTIKVEELEVGDYYGFELDGNHLYCLSDFSVTHNTSLALTILNNTDKLGEQSIFFSLDMGEQDVYQKLIQRHTSRNSADIYDVYKKEDMEQIQKFERMLEKNYTNVSFCFKPTLDIDQMEKAIIEREEETGKEVKFIIVDYLDLIRTQANDPTQSSMQAIQGLRGLAQNMSVAVIVLLQPNKAGSKLNEPMMTYNSIKGSSAVAEVASAIISVHRPGAGLGDDNADRYFTINCLKNRNGRMFNLDFHWKGITGTIRELEHIEKVDLKGLREAKKEDKDNEERQGNSW